MRKNKLLVTLAFSTLFGNGAAVASGDASEIESEPIRCYILATAAASLPKGQALNLNIFTESERLVKLRY